MGSDADLRLSAAARSVLEFLGVVLVQGAPDVEAVLEHRLLLGVVDLIKLFAARVHQAFFLGVINYFGVDDLLALDVDVGVHHRVLHLEVRARVGG